MFESIRTLKTSPCARIEPFARFNERLVDSIERLERFNGRLERSDERLVDSDERLERSDETLDSPPEGSSGSTRG
ncbi:MAG TPA: hypothetical protein VNM67_11995 [Thermoanaerobaculia bacterium]|jgi:hypothetical protein|nr:hypothetical protein [Thermoanaerobaculia bacterium]